MLVSFPRKGYLQYWSKTAGIQHHSLLHWYENAQQPGYQALWVVLDMMCCSILQVDSSPAILTRSETGCRGYLVHSVHYSNIKILSNDHTKCIIMHHNLSGQHKVWQLTGYIPYKKYVSLTFSNCDPTLKHLHSSVINTPYILETFLSIVLQTSFQYYYHTVLTVLQGLKVNNFITLLLIVSEN
jgi:hypothetical protein